MANSKFYGTGRRKKSIARVYLSAGTGKITINKRDIDDYFGLETLKVVVRQPFTATETEGKFTAAASPARPEPSVTASPEPSCRRMRSIVPPSRRQVT